MDTEIEKVDRDKDFELTDDEKLKFRHYLELHSCSLAKLNRELKEIAENIHHLAFKYLLLDNELVTKEERLKMLDETEELLKSVGCKSNRKKP